MGCAVQHLNHRITVSNFIYVDGTKGWQDIQDSTQVMVQILLLQQVEQ